MATYQKPPILEAVIGVHLAAPLEGRVRERFRVKVQKDYPRLSELREFQIDAEKKTVAVEIRGHQLQSSDALDRIVLLPLEFNHARLAPYLGWDQLAAKATENWKTLLTMEQHPRLEKLTTRYINRVDIPVAKGSEPPNFHDYFSLGVYVPDGCFESRVPDFTVVLIDYTPDREIKFKIELSTVLPELIDHVSVILDIEAMTANPLPTRLDDAWALIDRLHEAKNQAFEKIITEKTRGLFK